MKVLYPPKKSETRAKFQLVHSFVECLECYDEIAINVAFRFSLTLRWSVDFDSRIASLVPLFERQLRPVLAEVSPLTDDQAPVEWLTDRMIVDYIAEGGGDIEEDLLPTAP